MRVMLATLVLNEMEWLRPLVDQHRGWPGLCGWCFVESSDAAYQAANPDAVDDAGLSTDGTTDWLADLERRDELVTHVTHGVSHHPRPEQGKCQARSRYLEAADRLRPDWVVVLDADEFYTHDDQHEINRLCRLAPPGCVGMILRQRHVWRPASIADRPLFGLEVTSGYWDVPHCRVWRWVPGMRYVNNHNIPDRPGGLSMAHGMAKLFGPARPQCVHLGFASSAAARKAKHMYYQARGEGRGDGRKMYTDSRSAWESWQPGDALPGRAKVTPYHGPVPEVFKEGEK